jgi:hypothetical protein
MHMMLPRHMHQGDGPRGSRRRSGARAASGSSGWRSRNHPEYLIALYLEPGARTANAPRARRRAPGVALLGPWPGSMRSCGGMGSPSAPENRGGRRRSCWPGLGPERRPCASSASRCRSARNGRSIHASDPGTSIRSGRRGAAIQGSRAETI